MRISNLEFTIAMKIAADRCLAAEVEEFMKEDAEETPVSSKIDKRVSRKLWFEEWKNARVFTLKTFKVALILFMCATTVFFMSTMTIKSVRAAFFGAIVTWYEDYVDVRYEDEPVDSGESKENVDEEIIPAQFGYLPDGWSITHEHSGNGIYSCDITNSDLGCIRFSQYKDYENGIKFDNDVYILDTISLNDDTIEAEFFMLEGGEYVLVWKDKYMYKLEAENIDITELVMIAENIK